MDLKQYEEYFFMQNRTLLLNPNSKSGKSKKKWKYFLGQGFDEIITNNEQYAIKKIIESDNEITVAAGGDGTINYAINGIMNSKKKKALGVFYLGTSPDFCKFYKTPINPKEALNVLNNNNREPIDIMKVTYVKNGSKAYFASSCNIGVGAQIADIANKIRKFLGEYLGTFIAALIAICCTKSFQAIINLDGAKFEFNCVYHIIVFKNNFIASGIHLNPETKPDDGKICVVVFEKPLLKILIGLYNGKIPKGTFLRYGKKVCIGTEPYKKIEFDGDPHGETPITIECLEKALELIK